MPGNDESPAAGASLRRARPDDVDTIRDLVDAAYVGYTPLLGRTPFPMLTDHAEAIRSHEVWVLEEDGKIVGVIDLVPSDDHLWVDNVAIQPTAQGRGLGRRLLAHAEERARALGLDRLGLLTNERYTANIAMYERLGYVETHREPRGGSDLVHFRKALVARG